MKKEEFLATDGHRSTQIRGAVMTTNLTSSSASIRVNPRSYLFSSSATFCVDPRLFSSFIYLAEDFLAAQHHSYGSDAGQADSHRFTQIRGES